VICIGDETRDIEAARATGLASGAVTWGYAKPAILAEHARPSCSRRCPKLFRISPHPDDRGRRRLTFRRRELLVSLEGFFGCTRCSDYWWLLFPLSWIAVRPWRNWLSYRAERDAGPDEDLCRNGGEPPAGLVSRLGARDWNFSAAPAPIGPAAATRITRTPGKRDR
jgi:hypothetical protein